MHLYQCVFALSRVSYKILLPAAPRFGISSKKKVSTIFCKVLSGITASSNFLLGFLLQVGHFKTLSPSLGMQRKQNVCRHSLIVCAFNK